MTPPPPPLGGTATAGRLGGAQVAPRIPRRTSGPGRRGATAPRTVPTAPIRTAPPFVQSLLRLPDARLLDRLLRGRAWIALVAVALLGIVFMQVSLLKLNSQISRDVASADTLERQNSQLRAAVSGLDAEARIQETAALTGLQMPAAGDVRYLDARQADAARAARSITPPDSVRAAAIRAATTDAGSTTASTQQAATTPTQPTATTQQAAPPAQSGTAQTAYSAPSQSTYSSSASAPTTTTSTTTAPTTTTAAPTTSSGGVAPPGTP
jgi:cell division protein FtsL